MQRRGGWREFELEEVGSRARRRTLLGSETCSEGGRSQEVAIGRRDRGSVGANERDRDMRRYNVCKKHV